jgi:hypothetical protein
LNSYSFFELSDTVCPDFYLLLIKNFSTILSITISYGWFFYRFNYVILTNFLFYDCYFSLYSFSFSFFTHKYILLYGWLQLLFLPILFRNFAIRHLRQSMLSMHIGSFGFQTGACQLDNFGLCCCIIKFI